MSRLTAVSIRPARADAMDLVAFVDMAGEGFASCFWSTMAGAGQSPIEIGRRPLKPFPGYKRGGGWVLLAKPHF